ncbi:MAG TPA: SRPBCC domain-containing protein [Thermoleophilaceae bacterium]|jgi:carbon monoxide dehydrogenase subunit G
MLLETEFTVSAPADRVWAELLDLEQLGACLPGSALARVNGDQTLQGKLTPTVGSTPLDLVGTLRSVDVDEDGHSASCLLRVRDAAGPGFASGLLRARVDGSNGAARVSLTLDGRLAATGVSEDSARAEAERLLGELATNLERSLGERASRVPQPAAAALPSRPPASLPEEEHPAAPSVPSVPTPLARAGAAGLLALLLALLFGKRFRRRGVWLEIRYRW